MLLTTPDGGFFSGRTKVRFILGALELVGGDFRSHLGC